ncbi:Protein SYM1 [Leucoagaricus sp. SymC.cos]|nr:Protein SYM1 [Leucoagaricus sp. SymC.cos]
MASLLRSYNAALIRRPLLTQCVTAAVLFGTGDVIAQQLVEKKGGQHDLHRTARLTVYGAFFFGPPMTAWYSLLNRLKFASPTRGLIYRVWLDQGLLTPVAVAYFYGSMSLLEGKVHEAVPRIQAAYVPTIIRNWAVYIPTQIINFSIVPPHLRLVTVCGVSLFWNTYLSVANAQHQKQLAVEGAEKVE